MDEHGSRTMFVGLILSFTLYGASLLVIPVLPAPIDRWVSISLMVVSIVMLAGWFLAVRGGWRLGRPPSRGERRAKMHSQQEREKQRRLNR